MKRVTGPSKYQDYTIRHSSINLVTSIEEEVGNAMHTFKNTARLSI